MANPDAEYIVERPDPQGMTATVTRERFKDCAPLPPLAYRAEPASIWGASIAVVNPCAAWRC